MNNVINFPLNGLQIGQTFSTRGANLDDFGNVEYQLGLRHLRLEKWSQAAFEEVTGFEWISLDNVTEIENFKTNLSGRKIWVSHSLENDLPAANMVMGDKVSDVLRAIDEALDMHLSEAEKNHGRTCFLEDLDWMEDDDNIRVCLGS